MTALSASQIATFTLCPRKWAFDKRDKVPRPDTPSTALGTRVHEILEAWLRDGTPPDLDETFSYENPKRPGEQVVRLPGRIAHEGLHLLPAPRTPGLDIEGWLSLRTRATVWTGRLDLRYVDAATGEAVVHDHKTTSSPAYAKTPETLRTDPQALLYAASEMVRLGVDRVRLDWLYLPTNGGKAWKVSLPVLRDDIAPDLDRIEETAVLIHRTHAAGLAARDIPGNPQACDAFGGCEYALICDRPPTDHFQGFDMTHPTSPDALSAMDALMAKLSGGVPLPPPPTTDQINPPEAPPPSPGLPPPAPPPPPAVVTVPPGGYASMERKDLKVLAVARGLIDDSSKLGKAALVSLLETQDGPSVPSAPPGLDAVNKILSQAIPPSPVAPEPPSASDLAGSPPAPIPPVPAIPSAPPAPPEPIRSVVFDAPPIAETLNDLAAKVHALDTAEIKRVATAVLTPPPAPEALPARPAPKLTHADRDFWTAVYTANAAHGHGAAEGAADLALKAKIARFGGIS